VAAICCFLTVSHTWGADADADAAADPEAGSLAALVKVHLPLTGSADQALQTTIRRTCDQLLTQARAQRDNRRPVLVLDLEPVQGGDGGGSSFERSLALARFICSREMAGVKTVAFVPQSLRSHAVLLALACEEIVMAPEATLGEASAEEIAEGPVPQTILAAYREIAETQLTIPVELALAMVDPEAEVYQVEAEDGTHFVLQQELEQFTSKREIVSQKVLVPRGTLAQFDGREGRRFGFVKYLAADKAGLAAALDVPVELLNEEQSLSDQWRPVVIDVAGELNARLARRVQTMMSEAIDRQGANWICLRIDSSGGDLQAGLDLASWLVRLDANSVRTVAYVPAEATGAAALAALACDQLAMHATARLETAIAHNRPGAPGDAEVAAAVDSIRQSLASRSDHTWSLLAAMIDPSLELAEYQNKTTGQSRLFCQAELTEQADAAAWQLKQVLNANQERLELDGKQAAERGVAWHVVDSFDDLKRQFGIEGEIPNPRPNQVLELIEALSTPEVAFILLMVGFAGIYIELRTPSIGVGGFVGAVALLLFFWSKHLNGTAGWLEVLLFAAGFAFLMLEIFVLPGFGIFGLGGGAMMLASVVLASLTFVSPHSDTEMAEMAQSVGTVALAGLGVILFSIASRRYLPQAPVLRNIILAPPEEEEREELGQRETLADYSHLIGKVGTAATHLRPAGKARFGHELLDVIAEAEPIDSGEKVLVIEARGPRVIVRSA
jgi:membrane-bound ClpP family serine protease